MRPRMPTSPARSIGGEPGIGLADRVAEAAHQDGVLDALAHLDAGADVNGTGPDAGDPIGHVCRIQPTRQNDRSGDVGGNERPIEDLSTPPVSLDMGIQEQGLGSGKGACEV